MPCDIAPSGPTACAILAAMDLTLSPDQLALQDRARPFAREVLQPLEVGFETAGGRIDPSVARDVKAKAIDANLHGGSFPQELGGQGWTLLEQVLVHEQLGQVTGGLWGLIPGGYNALVHCDSEQRPRYLEPSLRGERNGSYAITEAGAGSDARALAATAVRGPVRRASTSSTARNGSSPGRRTPTS